MNTKARFALILTLVLLGGAVLVAVTWAAPGAAPLAGGAPTVVAYQGEVRVNGTPYDGSGYFKFAIVNAAGTTTYWSNDGTMGGPPTAAVQLAVSEGLFGLLLGDTALDGMTQALTADVFSQPDRRLRVWFSASSSGTFDQLTPDTRIAAVPYALQAQEAADADTVDGLHASQLETHYQNVVIVAKSGGDYTSVQAAIDSITGAAADNPYLVWVAPGVYVEQVTMKPYVHLQGAGQDVTVITSASAAGSGAWPPTQATLVLASDVSLRDLTVGNVGAGDYNTAVLATAGMTRTLVADVTVQALGVGGSNYAIFLSGSGTGITLQQVAALAENGSSHNIGLVNHSGAEAVLHSGNYAARGGTDSWAIFNVLTATLEATSVTALGEDGSNLNTGLYNHNNSTAVLHGGDYTGRGGNQTGGAGASHYSTITAIGVTALAENGSGDVGNYAMGCYDNSTATLSGGVFIARGGVNNYALSNESNVTLEAEGVTALAEDGSVANHGLWNVNNAQATVRGGSFTGHGGTYAYGMYSEASGTTLDAAGVTALAENGSNTNLGLLIWDGAAAMLRGGSFTARGGAVTRGIFNLAAGSTLEAESVTVLAEIGTNTNFGLYNYGGAAAKLHGGSFTGRGGSTTRGIENADSGSTLTAESVTALGENGSSYNIGFGNYDSVTSTLRGGVFIARGGTDTYGISNMLTVTMKAENVTALAENGSGDNYGLWNGDNATMVLHGASLTGRGGTDAYGIYNEASDTMLDAAGVTALAENGSSNNYGLQNWSGAEATLRGSAFTGRGGTDARGIYNGGSGSTLEAESVSALGENGSSGWGLFNYLSSVVTADSSQFTGDLGGLYQNGGTVHLGVSQLDGGATISSGTLTCFQVYDGSYAAYTCP